MMCHSGTGGWCHVTGVGVAVDLEVAAEVVAGLLACGAGKRLAEEAGGGLAAGVIERVRKVFGSDARSLSALDKASAGGSSSAVSELASALAWYARQDQVFGRELAGWAVKAGRAPALQSVQAGRDVYTAGRDQVVVNYGRRDDRA
jgi:hypothetical protein